MRTVPGLFSVLASKPSFIIQPPPGCRSGNTRAVVRSSGRTPHHAVLRFLTVAVLLLALAACDGATSRADVTGLRLQREGEAYPTLTGYLVNEGDRPITSADVFVTLYDGDNRPLDDVIVQVRNVAAGDSARFEQRLDLQANGAKLKYIGAN